MKLTSKIAALDLKPLDNDLEKSFMACFPKKSREELTQRISDVAVLILAMTRAQAEELDQETGAVKDDNSPKHRKRLQQFKQALDTAFPEKIWMNCYGEKPLDWTPCCCSEQQPDKILAFLERTVMEYLPRSVNQPHDIVPLTFWPDVIESSDSLPSSPCVVIVDGISLFHPDIRRILMQVAARENKDVAVLVFSPVLLAQHPLDGNIEQELKEISDMAFPRFSDFFDTLCEVGMNEQRRFQRWLFTSIPELLLRFHNRASLSALLHKLGPQHMADLLRTDFPHPTNQYGEQKGMRLVHPGGQRGGFV